MFVTQLILFFLLYFQSSYANNYEHNLANVASSQLLPHAQLVGLDLCYEKIILIQVNLFQKLATSAEHVVYQVGQLIRASDKDLPVLHIEKIALFFIFEVQKMAFHSLDLNPSVFIVMSNRKTFCSLGMVLSNSAISALPESSVSCFQNYSYRKRKLNEWRGKVDVKPENQFAENIEKFM